MSFIFMKAWRIARFVTFDEAVIRRIDAAHAGHEYEIAGARAETPRAGRRDCTLG